jgi:hypothetical protein
VKQKMNKIISLNIARAFSTALILTLSSHHQPVLGQPETLEQKSDSVQSGKGTIGPAQRRSLKDKNKDDLRLKAEATEGIKFTGTPGIEEQKVTINWPSGKKSPRQLIADYLHKLPKPEGPLSLRTGELVYLGNESIAKSIPGKLFYVLRFRQWPIAIALPPPLAANNIFVVDKNAQVELITSIENLKKLMQRNVHGIVDVTAARRVVKSWLLLSQELAQDGMYQFEIPESGIARLESHELIMCGKASVKPIGGNSGEINATICFSQNGDISLIKETQNLLQGMRPICQSTKLLDKDPIVRKMAEQDLLIMGKAAKPYLEEQRAKVSPELRIAIDKIWHRILIEDR